MLEIGSTHFYFMTLTFYSHNTKCADLTRYSNSVDQADTHSMTKSNLLLQMHTVVQPSLHIMCVFTCDELAVKSHAKFHNSNKLLLGAI